MNIAQHRKNKGLSQYELARLLGYARRDTIGRWENNPDHVSLGNLKRYAEACDVSLAVLLGLTGDNTIVSRSVATGRIDVGDVVEIVCNSAGHLMVRKSEQIKEVIG